MNERIRELAERCGFRSNPDIYDRNQSFDIALFAELIVRECVAVADHSNVTGKSIIGERIQEYFGISA